MTPPPSAPILSAPNCRECGKLLAPDDVGQRPVKRGWLDFGTFFRNEWMCKACVLLAPKGYE